MNTFRAALIKRLEAPGITLKKVAEGAGVSYEQLKKLKQVEGRTTNVEDAMKIAQYFGLSLEDFILGKKTTTPPDLVSVLEKLSPAARSVLLKTAQAQLDEEDLARAKSDQALQE